MLVLSVRAEMRLEPSTSEIDETATELVSKELELGSTWTHQVDRGDPRSILALAGDMRTAAGNTSSTVTDVLPTAWTVPSDTVRVTLKVPAVAYEWPTVTPEPTAPSPNAQV